MFGKKKEEKFKQILELIEIIKVQFQKYSELKDGKTELEDKIKKLLVIRKQLLYNYYAIYTYKWFF